MVLNPKSLLLEGRNSVPTL